MRCCAVTHRAMQIRDDVRQGWSFTLDDGHSRIPYEVHQQIRRFLLRRGVSGDDLKELVEAVVLRLIEYYEVGDDWKRLCPTVARNVLVDHKKRTGREAQTRLEMVRRAGATGSEHLDPSQRAIQTEAIECLRERLAELPDKERKVFLLHISEGLSFRDIEKKHGIRKSTAEDAFNAAKRRLKAGLEREGHTSLGAGSCGPTMDRSTEVD